MSDKIKVTNDLLDAAGKYIDAHGGNAVVAGGIGIIQDEKYKFKLVISIVGKAPEKEEEC